MEFDRYDRQGLGRGWLHLGIGAFHRAHQAAYVDAILPDDPRWGITGVSLRSPRARDGLQPQGGLYTLLEDGPVPRARVIGSVVDVLFAGDDDILAALSQPELKVLSLTVTEKGYCLDPATGQLNLQHADIKSDLSGAPRSAIGWITAGLAARRAAGAGPFTVLSCDNLPNNGALVKQAVLQLAEAQDAGLRRWIEENVSFPASMVDRIVPAVTDADRDRVAALTGWADAMPIVTEPFSQWVVEDVFCTGRPRLETAGVQFVEDVAPFEAMKLRLLNGAHSTLAYMGCLMGLATVAEAVSHAPLARLVRGMMCREVIPLLTVPNTDLGAYVDQLMDRFANPSLHHKTAQIAIDGSQKIPQRLLASVREARARGLRHDRLLAAVAAWVHYTQSWPVNDPLAPRFAAGPEAVLDLVEVFADLSTDTAFRTAVLDLVAEMEHSGMASVLDRLVSDHD